MASAEFQEKNKSSVVNQQKKNEENIGSTTALDTNEILSAFEEQSHGHGCCDSSHHHHHHHGPMFDYEDIYGSSAPEKVKRKPKKVAPPKTVLAQNIPGHRGHENIDDLLNFINGPSKANSKKEKKK